MASPLPFLIRSHYVGAYKRFFLPPDNEGRIIGIVGIGRDITERRQIEEAMRESNKRLHATLSELKETQEKIVQQERLAAVGQLTAGIAHDFNNILTSILGFAELLRISPDMPLSAQADLAHIITSGRRAADLVRQMLDFSRKSIRRPEQLDLLPFVNEVSKFLTRVIPENIEFNLEIQPGVYQLEADPTQIQRMLTNLTLNARDAMPNGGTLQVFLAQGEVQGEVICVECNQVIKGMWIRITVKDTGLGIPSEVLPHIFEPFFTTKAVGEGTGLGLAQVLGIVQQHAGHLTVESRVAEGATFTIYLRPSSLPQPLAKLAERTPLQSGQGQTILLVEDEPAVLAAIKHTLEYLGYQTLTALNGREALDVYAVYKDKIALVLSDMVMPDMDGVTLFHSLKAQNPEIKLVMMSGYPFEEKGVKLLEQGVVNWFQKPISLEGLSQIINQAMAEKSTAS